MNTEKRDCYRLGNYEFEIRHGGEILFPPFLERFRIEQAEGRAKPETMADIFDLQLTDHLPQPKGVPVAHRADLDVYASSASLAKSGAVREARLLRFVGAADPYGYYEEMEEHRYCVWLQRDYLAYSQIDTVFYSLFALERHLLEKTGLILHCAMLRVGEEALLFSGPSGIGKSTHAQLWCTHATDAQVINGDRALLQYGSDRLFAYGWCVSGSSEICINRSLPVRAIIFLRQEQKNDGVQLHGLRAVKNLVSQITVNSWNPQAVERVWELTERIAADVPIFDYGCNMEPEAVDVLRQLLGMQNADISGTEPDGSVSRLCVTGRNE